MDMKDIRIDTYTNSSRWVDMKIVHEPTGICVEGCEQAQYFLKQRLLKELEEKINKDT